ncbi:MAG: zinc ribbon domain-containing protein [Clostridia bacterium]|nr:zinc ribbon domain-containing protein [Clostridia bacterium]
MVRIVHQTVKGIFTCVIELISGRFTKQDIVHGKILYFLIFCQHRILRIGQDTVKPADYSKRENNIPVFMRFIHSCKFVSDRPDKIRFLIDFCASHMASENFTSEQIRAYMKESLPKLKYWKK